MSDKYGYIGIETLLNYCQNSVDHAITPNVFMRMNRVKIEERPHGKWTRLDEYESVWRCSACDEVSCCKADFCPNCGADMRGDEE